MKKRLLMAAFLVANLMTWSSCSNDAPTAEETATPVTDVTVTETVNVTEQADSVANAAMDETQKDIEMKTKALQDVLDLMDNMGQ